MLLTRIEAAKYLKIQPETLKNWASSKKYNLPFIKYGKTVVYRLEDLESFIKSHFIRLNNQ